MATYEEKRQAYENEVLRSLRNEEPALAVQAEERVAKMHGHESWSMLLDYCADDPAPAIPPLTGTRDEKIRTLRSRVEDMHDLKQEWTRHRVKDEVAIAAGFASWSTMLEEIEDDAISTPRPAIAPTARDVLALHRSLRALGSKVAALDQVQSEAVAAYRAANGAISLSTAEAEVGARYGFNSFKSLLTKIIDDTKFHITTHTEQPIMEVVDSAKIVNVQFNVREFDILCEISGEQQMTNAQILRQALRLYQHVKDKQAKGQRIKFTRDGSDGEESFFLL